MSHTDIIQGEFRVVSTEPLTAWRASPNRRRAVARMVLWNAALMVALVALPIVFH
jgi:hypothetical protein